MPTHRVIQSLPGGIHGSVSELHLRQHGGKASSSATTTSSSNVILLYYDDLKADLEGQMRALARRLSIRIPEERWPALVKAATFDEMRGAADNLVPGVTESHWRDNAQFFHSGSSGQWRRLFDETELARYDARVRELVEPDLAEWLHR